MPTELERLTVLIEANTKSYERAMLRLQAQTDKAIRGASRSVNGLNRQLATASKAASAFSKAFGVGLGVATFRQFASAIRETVGQADDMQDLADKIGITAENLQELQYQAKLNGSNTEDMNAALDQFTKRIGEAASGSGALLKILKEHNIELRDQAGNLRPITDLLADYAEIIKTAGSDAERLALAQAAFKNVDMASVFRNGAAGIKQFANEAHRASQVISNETIKALADIQPELDRLEGAWNVAWANITLRTLQALEKIGQAEHAILDPVINAISHAGQDIAAGHLQHLRDLQRRGLAPGVTPFFPGKEKDDLVLPSPGSRAQYFPGKAKDDLVQFTAEVVKHADARNQVAAAVQDETRSLDKQNVVLEANDEANRQLIDQLDEIRYAASSALDAFVQSIANSEGPLKAMKAALQDILQTIIRIAEQALITKLFGAFGTATLGGFSIPSLSLGGGGPAAAAGGGGQQVSVHVTASPLFDVKIRQSEARSVARGPAVARDNQQRFAVP